MENSEKIHTYTLANSKHFLFSIFFLKSCSFLSEKLPKGKLRDSKKKWTSSKLTVASWAIIIKQTKICGPSILSEINCAFRFVINFCISYSLSFLRHFNLRALCVSFLYWRRDHSNVFESRNFHWMEPVVVIRCD